MHVFGLFALLVTAGTAGQADAKVELEHRVRRVPATNGVHASSIRAVSRLVTVPVTVLDARGVPVRGLPLERFRLFEDGVEQTIQSFGQDDAPVSIGIVFDASRSMQSKLVQAREAVTKLFEESLPGDEFHLVEFNDSPRVICKLTRDIATLRTALDSVSAHGWTALFDAIFLGAQQMRGAHNMRRALVIISDGDDNFSRYQESELSSYLKEAGVVVYSIALSAGSLINYYDARHLRRFSMETGGWCYSLGKLDRLAETVKAIGDAIRNQYVLSYQPSNSTSDGKFRKIAVQISPPTTSEGKSSGLSVSWRSGYHAPDFR